MKPFLQRTSLQPGQSSVQGAFLISLRVATGFTAMTLLLLNAALWLGLIPDRTQNVVDERTFLAQSLAVTYSGLIQMDNQQQIRPMLEDIVHRTPALLSAGIRDKDGKLLVEIGDHEAHWTNRTGSHSTDSQLKVPLAMNKTLLGDVELRFTPIPRNRFGLLPDDIFHLFVFIALASFMVHSGFIWFVLGRVLTASTSDFIPKRIRASLDTLAEGVLILDQQQRIVLANESFAHLIAKLPKDVEGQNVSSLPWSIAGGQEGIATPYPWQRPATANESCSGIIIRLQTAASRLESLSVNSMPIHSQDGSYRGTMLTFDNLTEIEEKKRLSATYAGRTICRQGAGGSLQSG